MKGTRHQASIARRFIPAALVRMDKASPSRAKIALAAGFTSLVVLLLALGFFAADALRRARLVASESTQSYLARRATLNEIRRSVFAVGTHLRDFLLDPEEGNLRSHAERARSALRQASDVLIRDERDREKRKSGLALASLRGLQGRLAGLEAVAGKALRFSQSQREDSGYDTLTREITPARESFLAALDQQVTNDQAALEASVRDTAVSLDRLQSQLWLAIGFSVLLGALLAALTYRYLAKLEAVAAERYHQSMESAVAMEQLSHRLLVIQEEERKSLARELHDEVGQSLSAVLVDLSQAKNALVLNPEEAQVRLAAAIRLGEQTLGSVRDLSLLLRPSILDDLGLVPALHWQAREVSRRTGMLVSFHSDQEDLELDEERRTAVFRVVQEALHNAARHSGAKSAEVDISSKQGRLQIMVSDTGKGFEPDLTRGLGILGMQERVARLMGTFRISSVPGVGTAVTVDLPLDKASPA